MNGLEFDTSPPNILILTEWEEGGIMMHKSAWEIACAKGRDLISDQVGWIYRFELLNTDFLEAKHDELGDDWLEAEFHKTNYVGYGELNESPENALDFACLRLKRVDAKLNS